MEVLEFKKVLKACVKTNALCELYIFVFCDDMASSFKIKIIIYKLKSAIRHRTLAVKNCQSRHQN